MFTPAAPCASRANGWRAQPSAAGFPVGRTGRSTVATTAGSSCPGTTVGRVARGVPYARRGSVRAAPTPISAASSSATHAGIHAQARQAASVTGPVRNDRLGSPPTKRREWRAAVREHVPLCMVRQPGYHTRMPIREGPVALRPRLTTGLPFRPFGELTVKGKPLCVTSYSHRASARWGRLGDGQDLRGSRSFPVWRILMRTRERADLCSSRDSSCPSRCPGCPRPPPERCGRR